MDYSVLVVAAGKHAGEGQSYEKALASFKGERSVLEQTLSVFLEDVKCRQIVVVTSSADLRRLVEQHGKGKIVYVKGGKTRQESVLIGLHAVSEDIVLIHDGVRPWIQHDYIDGLLQRMETEKAAVLAVNLKGSLRVVAEGYLQGCVDTAEMMLVQTPQAYHTDFVIDCYRKAAHQDVSFMDDAELVSAFSDVKIAVEMGDPRNARFVLKK